MRLTIKTKVEKEETIEFETPSFYKFGSCVFKFIETCGLRVWPYAQSITKITLKDDESDYVHALTKGEKITEEQFNEAYFSIHNQHAEIQLYNQLKIA